jgi:lipopolysaccharide transport system permease protein
VNGPELLLQGTTRKSLWKSVRESWGFRGTLLAFAERNIRVKYKQAALGVLWAVLQPLAFMTIFTLALGRLVKTPEGDIPYAALALTALVPWGYLQTAVSFGAEALLADATLVRKVYFPREIPVLAAVVSAGMDLLIGLALVLVAGPLLGAHPSPSWLLVPVLALPLAVLAGGVALLLGALNCYYRDFRYLLPVMLQVWLFASPVAYPLSVVPTQWQALYVTVNPAAGMLEAFRQVLARGALPQWELLGASLVVSLLLLWGGYAVFKALEPNFADVL